MKKIFTFFILLSFLSCEVKKIPTTYSKLNDIELNKVYTKDLGNTLFRYEEAYYKPAIIIKKGTKLKNVSIKDEIEPGQTYMMHDHVGNQMSFIYTNSDNIEVFKIILYENSTKQKVMYNARGRWLTYYTENRIEFTQTKLPDKQQPYFNKEFIYNGKSGNTIKFMYRELTENMARPAFYQETQYDLSESNVIGFQSMRIEVLEATNTKLTYKVLSGF